MIDAVHRRRGLVLVAVSALLFSTPGLFTRGVSAGGWDVIFWRGLFGAIFTVIYLTWRRRLSIEFTTLGPVGWATAALWTVGSISYLQAFKHTSIANVAMIYGSAPMFSALAGWLFLRERPRRIVLFASALAFAGVSVIGWGSLGGGGVVGDVLAVIMTILMAVQFAIYRKYPALPSGSVAILASLFALPVCLIWGTPMTVSSGEIAVLAVFGAVFVAASILLNEGSKLLPSSETALVSNLEVPLQPVLAYAIFHDVPALATFAGGVFILVAIALSAWPRTNQS